jgi:hypothetical protein
MHRWLKSRGKILVTLGTSDMDCDTEADRLGAPMIWSSYPPEAYLRILDRTGFTVRKSGFEGAPGDQEYHFWLLAEKRQKLNPVGEIPFLPILKYVCSGKIHWAVVYLRCC